MALTEEQRSLLQLLLQGQSYDDIGSLLGTGAEDVRTRARAALTEIGGTDPDARIGLSDFLLGQADPIGRADAVRQLQNDPDANGLAQSLVAQLRLLAPQAQLPEIPPVRGGRTAKPAPPPAPGSTVAAGSPPAAPAPGHGGEALPTRIGGALRNLGGGDPRRAKALVALGLLALLVIVVVLVVLVAGGDDGDDGGGGSAATETTAASDELTIVQLAPLDAGSDAEGQAVFAQTNQDQPVLQINLVGLEPAPNGQTYIVWLYSSDRAAFPIARDQVQQNGALTGAAAISQAVTPLLGQFGCVDVSLASNAETRRALQQAVSGQSLPAHVGRTVLRGEIPAAPGEQAASGADSVCDRAAASPEGGDQGGDEGAGQG
jgi:hypothetical protein